MSSLIYRQGDPKILRIKNAVSDVLRYELLEGKIDKFEVNFPRQTNVSNGILNIDVKIQIKHTRHELFFEARGF